MEILNKAAAVYFGQNTTMVKKVFVGDNLVWPTAYVGVLVPEWTTSGTIAVTGGSRQLKWNYYIYQGGDLTNPVASGVVADTINVGVTLSDGTNFSYTGNYQSTASISAGSRGTNGYGSSGSQIPQSAGARYCTIQAASYNTTYDGNSVICSYSDNSFTVWQDANNVQTYGNPSYGVVLTVNNYTTSETQAPASGGSGTWGVSGSKIQDYIFSTNEHYLCTTDLASSQISVTCAASWVTIYNNGTFSVETRDVEPGPQRNTNIFATVTGTSTYDLKTVFQQFNWPGEPNKTYTGATISSVSTQWGSLSANITPSAGGTGTFSFTATKAYTSTVVYTSGAPAVGPSGSDPIPFGTGGFTIHSKPSWITNIGESSITASKQSKYITSDTTGTIFVRAYYDSTHYASGSVTLTRKGTFVTYSIVCVSHPSGVSLPAYASTVALTFDGYKSYDNGDADDITQDVYGEYVSGSDVVEQGVTRISHGVGEVYGGNLGTKEFNAASTTYTYKWSSYTSATCQVVVSQSLNRIESTAEGEWIEGQTTYGQPTLEIKPNSYYVDSSLDPNYGSGNPAPKAGGVAILTVEAGHQERTGTPWSRTDTRTDTHTWTSLETSTTTLEDPKSGTTYDYPNYHKVTTDTPSFTIDPTTWLSVSATATAGVYSVGITANTGNSRNGVVYVNNNGASDVYHIYQKAGNISILVHDGNNNPVTWMNYAASGGTITVYVAAQSTTWKIVTVSGWPWSTGATFVPSLNTGGQTGTTLSFTISTMAAQNKVGQFRVVSDSDSDVYYEVNVRQGPGITPGPE